MGIQTRVESQVMEGILFRKDEGNGLERNISTIEKQGKQYH